MTRAKKNVELFQNVDRASRWRLLNNVLKFEMFAFTTEMCNIILYCKYLQFLYESINKNRWKKYFLYFLTNYIKFFSELSTQKLKWISKKYKNTKIEVSSYLIYTVCPAMWWGRGQMILNKSIFSLRWLTADMIWYSGVLDNILVVVLGKWKACFCLEAILWIEKLSCEQSAGYWIMLLCD